MHSMRSVIVYVMLILLASLAGGFRLASAQNTGYAVKKPVIGGACALCPWGAMADVVREAMLLYGWDVQICHNCAGGARAARHVASALIPEPRAVASGHMPTPKGPVDFGVTGAHYLQWAYVGIDFFANTPELPLYKKFRLVANIQEPTYLIVAVKADSRFSGITDLSEIVKERMPVKLLAIFRGGNLMRIILDYYGLTQEKVESFGGAYSTRYSEGEDFDIVMGIGSLVNAPEFRMWYRISQIYDLKYLEVAEDLREKLVKERYLEQRNLPFGYLRGVDRPIPTVGRTGTAIYGREDMPDDFAYTLAKAMDEQQHLLHWTHMNFSYNPHTVWKAFDVPLHPGAARYYKERGYMK
ncbi:MAG: hypothetical protein O7E51_05495 [Acidobacteria bacterium]|nr:hypothetical protein [Acidobacteriota bacterium]